VQALTKKGIKSSIAGELTEPGRGMILINKGVEGKLEHPIVDPFWKAFYQALERHKV
jgi:hydrogenase expression/formation protein HypE